MEHGRVHCRGNLVFLRFVHFVFGLLLCQAVMGADWAGVTVPAGWDAQLNRSWSGNYIPDGTYNGRTKYTCADYENVQIAYGWIITGAWSLGSTTDGAADYATQKTTATDQDTPDWYKNNGATIMSPAYPTEYVPEEGDPGYTTNNYWTSNAVAVVTNQITVIASNTLYITVNTSNLVSLSEDILAALDPALANIEEFAGGIEDILLGNTPSAISEMHGDLESLSDWGNPSTGEGIMVQLHPGAATLTPRKSKLLISNTL